MRIVDVCAFYTPHGGGVRTYIDRKLQALPALGHEIVVIAPGPHNSVVERAPGAILVTIAQPALPFDRRYHFFDDRNALHDALDAWRPDLVEASSPWSSATKVAEWQGSAPRALFMHADPLSAYAYRWLGRIASRQRIDRVFSPFWNHLRTLDAGFDLVVSPGASLTRRLTEGGLDKVVTVPLGVEPGIFRPARSSAEVRDEMRARLGLPEDGLILLGVGRFASEKRWPMVIRAVAAAGRDRPVGLLLVGAGKQRAKLEHEAAAFPHIVVAQPTADRDELAAILASADALVHGCEAETFCLVASEARASGLPIIVPDAGGAFDQLSAGAGLSYAATSEASLAETIVRFHDAAPGAFDRRPATAARVRTMDQHFWDLMVRYERLAPDVPSRRSHLHRAIA
ncbi:glycosyltransferase [Sphingomonas sp. RB1R13]|uniref:glycosyltransferase n=1 Tax=Sphingomonas sp. RB1R13 TaxID=3096159 RepID=UPI002FCB5BCA